MIDLKTLELIKNNQYSTGTNFQEELRGIIHDFYENFDLDKSDPKYRELYVRNFVSQHEAFLVNYQTNVYNPNLKATDKLSDEITLNKFLDTLSSYLTKYYDEEQEA